MTITRRRIINPQRYLYALHPGDKFYIAIPLEMEDYPRLQSYGLLPESPARIPIPQKAATRMNANGKWKIRKDLPKEERFFEHDYHIVDWHGTDHYGTCWQSRWCYQRELIPPTELAFIIEDGVLYSPLLENADDNKFTCIKAAMNIALEMLGRCEVWTVERAPVVPPVKQSEVPWEILRPGSRIQDDWAQYIDEIIERKPKGQQAVIRNRHEHLWHMAPDFCVLGSQNFWGYVVYGFTALNLFVFESNEINNATYAFRGDWEAASKLTKTEVLSGHVQEARVYHSDKWYENTRKLIADLGKGGSIMGKNQHVTPHPKGGWQVKGAGNTRATVRTSTQKEAADIARKIAINQQSERLIHRVTGEIRQKDSYGHDPYPPKG